jgi:sarcosine oxidase subunit delta
VSFLLECPHCGAREATEFVYGGEVMQRPTGRPPSRRELSSYLYFRENVPGPQREWWFHSSGCGRWLIANRDTRRGVVAGTHAAATNTAAGSSGGAEGS